MKHVTIALAILISFMAIGIGMATVVPTLTYQSYTDRPYNFVVSDYATVSGYNAFQASSLANAGGIDEMTKVTTLPSNPGGAPDEQSFQQIYMDFYKDGTVVDPAVQESITSDITVGTLSNSVVPTFDSSGNLVTTKMGEGYDIAALTVGAVVGTPITSNNVLTGITDDQQRYVFGNVQSYQDDHISATGMDSAGTDSNVLTSWTTASVGSPTMPENTPYVKFDWSDLRGYNVDINNVAWSGTGWTIQNTVNFAQILPADYRSGAYL